MSDIIDLEARAKKWTVGAISRATSIKIRLLPRRPPRGRVPARFGKNSDALWLSAAGVTHEQMVEVVRGTIIDGEVYDWVRTHVHKSAAEKAAHRAAMLDFPPAGDAAAQAFFEQRKAAYGMSDRQDIKTRGDMIDADEGRFRQPTPPIVNRRRSRGRRMPAPQRLF